MTTTTTARYLIAETAAALCPCCGGHAPEVTEHPGIARCSHCGAHYGRCTRMWAAFHALWISAWAHETSMDDARYIDLLLTGPEPTTGDNPGEARVHGWVDQKGFILQMG